MHHSYSTTQSNSSKTNINKPMFFVFSKHFPIHSNSLNNNNNNKKNFHQTKLVKPKRTSFDPCSFLFSKRTNKLYVAERKTNSSTNSSRKIRWKGRECGPVCSPLNNSLLRPLKPQMVGKAEGRGINHCKTCIYCCVRVCARALKYVRGASGRILSKLITITGGTEFFLFKRII